MDTSLIPVFFLAVFCVWQGWQLSLARQRETSLRTAVKEIQVVLEARQRELEEKAERLHEATSKLLSLIHI